MRIFVIILLLWVLPLPLYAATLPQSVYTIQTVSLRDIQTANKHFDAITRKLVEQKLEYLRTERIGEYYSLRLGKFDGHASAEKFLKTIKSQLPLAMVMKAYYKEERIVRMYESPRQLREKAIQEPVSSEMPDEIKTQARKTHDQIIERKDQKEIQKQQKVFTQAEEQEPLYSAGPWKGKVIEAVAKVPVEKAVVAAIWHRQYDTRFTVLTDVHDAQEVLTDDEGNFEIPAYTETGKHKDTWRKPNIPGPEGPVEFFIRGPVIDDPKFIIYKPGFAPYPDQAELIIFPTKSFYVDYAEFYKANVKGETLTLFKNSTKNFPEGLIYTGQACSPFLDKFRKTSDFRIGSVFLPMNNAEERIKRLDIPLDCPEQAEPIPELIPGYKHDLKNPLKKGGYVLIEVSKVTTEENRSIIPKEPSDIVANKLPLLLQFIKEGRALRERETGKDKP